jgi:hypothetical protein
MRLGAVDSVVTGQCGTDDGTFHKTDYSGDRRSSTLATNKAPTFPRYGTYVGACASTHCGEN